MPADAPTILASSGGIKPGTRTRWELNALTEYALDLSGVTGCAPRVCFVPTASGDDRALLSAFYEAAQQRGLAASHLVCFRCRTSRTGWPL